MARGTTARMRRGSEATWQGRGWPTRGTGGARRGHVAKGHATTRVHVGARVGCHMASGFAHGGPVWGATWRYLSAPNSVIFPMWDYVPHVLPFAGAGRVAAYRMSDAIRTATIAWTGVHGISKSARALISL